MVAEIALLLQDADLLNSFMGDLRFHCRTDKLSVSVARSLPEVCA